MSLINVLVVDDQRLVRDGISSLLKLAPEIGEVWTADDGHQGVSKALELKPDIILMDIRMPVLDGIGAVLTLNEKKFEGKVIMLTTFDDQEYVRKSLQAGALGYFLKNIPPEELIRGVIQAHQGVFQMDAEVARSLGTYLADSQSQKEELSHKANLNPEQQKLISYLTSREKEVLLLLGEGASNEEIAGELNLSRGTIKNYVTHILDTLGFRDRVQAALFVSRYELNIKS